MKHLLGVLLISTLLLTACGSADSMSSSEGFGEHLQRGIGHIK